MHTFANLEEFSAAAGTEIGVSDWVLIDQERINRFADATDDHQWIHTDPERAAAGPFGAPIAHGLLTLSLHGGLLSSVFTVAGVRMGVNYGLNKVRFPAPVPVGSQVRMRIRIGEIIEVPGGVQATLPGAIEIRDGAKPACVFEAIVRYLA